MTTQATNGSASRSPIRAGIPPGFIDIGTTAPTDRGGRTFQALGHANVAGGSLQYLLRDSGGQLVQGGSMQARGSGGAASSFRSTIEVPTDTPDGTYRLSVFSRSPTSNAVQHRDDVAVRFGPVTGPRPSAASSINLATPRPHQRTGGAFDIVGVSNVHDAALRFTVSNSRGHTVRRGSIATPGTTEAPGFFRTVSDLPATARAGVYALKVYAQSPADGQVADSVTRRFRVTEKDLHTRPL